MPRRQPKGTESYALFLPGIDLKNIFQYNTLDKCFIIKTWGAAENTLKEWKNIKKAAKGIVIISAVIYVAILYFMLFVGFGREMVVMSEDMLDNYNYWHAINLIPFQTITEYIVAIAHGSIKGHAIRNLLGNLFLFFPAGFYLPFFVKKATSMKAYSIVMAATILAVELAQVVTKSGSLDVDDFLLNFAGAFLGFIFFNRIRLSK